MFDRNDAATPRHALMHYDERQHTLYRLAHTFLTLRAIDDWQ